MIKRSIIPMLAIVAFFEGLKITLGLAFAQAFAFGFASAVLLVILESIREPQS